MCTSALYVSHAPAACFGDCKLLSHNAERVCTSLLQCPPAGESERRLREAFEGAEAEARRGQPVVIFLDEIDAMCPRRDAGRQHEARVVAQLLTLMDGAASKAGK